MNEDKAKGGMKEMKGRTKEAAGSLTGNRKLEAKGKAETAGGKLQKGVGKARDEAERRP
jgi:uncharacterized protein YjbJ (UPF0337 family)